MSVRVGLLHINGDLSLLFLSKVVMILNVMIFCLLFRRLVCLEFLKVIVRFIISSFLKG